MDNLLYRGGAGSSASNPLLPLNFCTNPPPPPPGFGFGECIYQFSPIPLTEVFLDPVLANAYTYETLNGVLFTSLGGLPAGFARPFAVSSGGTLLGHYGPGETVTFPGGTTAFTISGIDPAVDGSDRAIFPVRVTFDRSGAEVQSTAFFQSAPSAVPEPATGLYLGIGLLAVAVAAGPKSPRD